jgi:hypothetical protein
MTALVPRRRILLAAGVAVACSFLASGVRASTRAETLQAIHVVENPRNSPKPGKHGELGPYQFRSGTWRMHTTLPFSRALDRQAADEVAIRHYEWLRRGLIRNGLEATPYNIGLAWNAGLSAAVRRRAPAAAHNYAERVSNLVQHYLSSRLATAE